MCVFQLFLITVWCLRWRIGLLNRALLFLSNNCCKYTLCTSLYKKIFTYSYGLICILTRTRKWALGKREYFIFLEEQYTSRQFGIKMCKTLSAILWSTFDLNDNHFDDIWHVKNVRVKSKKVRVLMFRNCLFWVKWKTYLLLFTIIWILKIILTMFEEPITDACIDSFVRNLYVICPCRNAMQLLSKRDAESQHYHTIIVYS